MCAAEAAPTLLAQIVTTRTCGAHADRCLASVLSLESCDASRLEDASVPQAPSCGPNLTGRSSPSSTGAVKSTLGLSAGTGAKLLEPSNSCPSMPMVPYIPTQSNQTTPNRTSSPDHRAHIDPDHRVGGIVLPHLGVRSRTIERSTASGLRCYWIRLASSCSNVGPTGVPNPSAVAATSPFVTNWQPVISTSIVTCSPSV